MHAEKQKKHSWSGHKPGAQLALINTAPGSPSPALAGESRVRADKLWLCVHLPQLAVDALAASGGAQQARAAIETSGGRILIHACNDIAAKQGVRLGMTHGAALALCADLESLPRDRAAESGKLNAVAAAACNLSSEVSLYGEDGIVLEVRSSLKLFGGLQVVLQRAEQEFRALGVHFLFGMAQTPKAASWLARYRPGSRVLFPEQLPAALRELPIDALVEEEKQIEQLQRSGVRHIADLTRLPRAGVARRFGPQLLRRLDQALGGETEVLGRFAAPAVFRAGEELYPPVSDWSVLQPLAQKLLQQLERYLLRRQAATPALHCLLWHRRAPVTVLRLGVSRPERRAELFLELLRERFDKTALPEEVVGFGIYCSEIHVLPAETLHLLDGRAKLRQHWLEFTDRLSARLGREKLSRLSVHADHRPEKGNRSRTDTAQDAPPHPALSRTEKGDRFIFLSSGLSPVRKINLSPFSNLPSTRRPAWLLPQPVLLRQVDERLQWNGPLTLAQSPERIEQGWWDGADVRRDYYVARNPAGTRLWVYRDQRDRRWYLHGIFS